LSFEPNGVEIGGRRRCGRAFHEVFEVTIGELCHQVSSVFELEPTVEARDVRVQSCLAVLYQICKDISLAPCIVRLGDDFERDAG
jgi:hypothetical protein